MVSFRHSSKMHYHTFHLAASEFLHTSQVLTASIVPVNSNQVIAFVAVEPTGIVPRLPHVVVDAVSELLGLVVRMTTSSLFQFPKCIAVSRVGTGTKVSSDEVAVLTSGPTLTETMANDLVYRMQLQTHPRSEFVKT